MPTRTTNGTVAYTLGGIQYTVASTSSARFTRPVERIGFIQLADAYSKPDLIEQYYELQESLLELYPDDLKRTLKLTNIYKDC